MYYLKNEYPNNIIVCNPYNKILCRFMHWDYANESEALQAAENLINTLNSVNETDLFNNPDLLPLSIQQMLIDFEKKENSCNNCDELLKSFEKLGYTFKFGLDCIPYYLRIQNKNILPNCEDYRILLHKAVEKFNISFDNAREKFGKFNYQDWENLFNSKNSKK